MSQFPSLKPSARTFTPGSLPISTFASISGKETRVILGDTPHNHSIALTFQHVQEPSAELITNHWYDRLGTALDFSLPADVWAGWASYLNAITPGQKWRYTQQPSVESVSPGILNVSVELISLA